LADLLKVSLLSVSMQLLTVVSGCSNRRNYLHSDTVSQYMTTSV